MDLQYNIFKLDDILDNLLKEVFNKSGKKATYKLIDDLMNEREIDSDLELKKELNKFSSDSIRLSLEKKILLSIENKALANRKSYWEVLKSRAPRIKTGIMAHYYDSYIDDLKRNNNEKYEARTITELNTVYNNEIKSSLEKFTPDMSALVDGLSSVTLEHMENVNANGRVIKVDGKKKGGIFLDKNSKISYGKFVNKEEFITMLNNLENNSTPFVTNSEIGISDLKVIVQSVNSCLNFEQNQKLKRTDAKTITIGQAGLKKAGSVFLGKEAELPDGSYVSLEEINYAINSYINKKKAEKIEKIPKRSHKVVELKSKVKKFALAAAAAVTVLVSTLPGFKKSETKEITSNPPIRVERLYDTEVSMDNYESDNEIVANTNVIEKSNPEIVVINNIEKEELPTLNVENEINQSDLPTVSNEENTEVNENVSTENTNPIEEVQVETPIENENSLIEEAKVEEPIEDSEDKIIYNDLVPTHQAKAYDADYELRRYLYAIAQHEAGGDIGDNRYTDAKAVISTILNRAGDERWISYCKGDTIETMLFFSGQYMSKAQLEALAYYKNPDLLLPEIIQAVDDCLAGSRNHYYTSYRGKKNVASDREQFVSGGNNYFSPIETPVEEVAMVSENMDINSEMLDSNLEIEQVSVGRTI